MSKRHLAGGVVKALVAVATAAGLERPLGEILADLQSGDSQERYKAASELRYAGPDYAAAVPALVAALGDADAETRESALEALGNMGGRAQAALPSTAPLDQHT